ncbi:recombinase family protein [Halanaerobaculum tunisiense]
MIDRAEKGLWNGAPTPLGYNYDQWTTKTISQILRNPIYKGDYRYNYKESARGKIKDKEGWVVVEDAFPAIISNQQ